MSSSRKYVVEQITGRDCYIVARALVYAVETIKSLPCRRQEISECEEMEKILAMITNGPTRRDLTENVRRHLSRELNRYDGYPH
jgi:hypothetical protein